MTDLPMMWGEGDPADILAGRTGRSETLKALDAVVQVTPIDTLNAATLGHRIAIIAQPRRLSPHELVDVDGWVRRGGRAIIFADPELRWPSRFALGDPRRAPPVTLLDPLLAHWGMTLGDSDGAVRTASVDGVTIAFDAAGRWAAKPGCTQPAPQILDCPIGKGRVVMVADADLLDPRVWQAERAGTPRWLTLTVQRLAGQVPPESNRSILLFSGGVIAAIALGGALIYRRLRGT